MTSPTADQVFKIDRRGRVRVPRERREALLEEFGRSGMSAMQFAGHYGLKYQTFATWLQKRGKRVSSGAVAEAGNALGPVRFFEPAVALAEPGALVVELPGGSRMRVETAGQAALAGQLLASLAQRLPSLC